jgi:hypothetical protein
MLHLVPLHHMTPRCSHCNVKAPRRGQMPPAASRQADPFGMFAKLLSTSFDAGVPLRDVQEAASHAGPRTTMRYDRARTSLDAEVLNTGFTAVGSA